jgi:AcrR family transcriptional regulator
MPTLRRWRRTGTLIILVRVARKCARCEGYAATASRDCRTLLRPARARATTLARAAALKNPSRMRPTTTARSAVSTEASHTTQPPRRRTNAERSATARRKLIDAALETLCEQGYGATTTDLVARRAKLSRGAMLHHFRTRVDLMAAVVEHVIAEQSRLRRERVEAFPPGPQRFFEASDISWEIQKQPATVVLLEIILATRSDRVLKKRLAPMVLRLGQLRTEAAERMVQNLRLDKQDALVDMMRIHLATLRGLAIERMFTQAPEEIDRAQRLLTRYEHAFVRELIDGEQPTGEARTHSHNGKAAP